MTVDLIAFTGRCITPDGEARAFDGRIGHDADGNTLTRAAMPDALVWWLREALPTRVLARMPEGTELEQLTVEFRHEGPAPKWTSELAAAEAERTRAHYGTGRAAEVDNA